MFSIEYVKNPIYVNAQMTEIDMLVKFKELDEELNYTATNLDKETHGIDLYQNAKNGDYGVIAPYIAPNAEE